MSRAELARGREHYANKAWTEAHRALSLAEQSGALEGADLELLATAAYLLGREDEYLEPSNGPIWRTSGEGTCCALRGVRSGWGCASPFAARPAKRPAGSRARSA